MTAAEKMFAAQRKTRDVISINGQRYEIRRTNGGGLEAWAESCGHWYRINDRSGITLSDCLSEIRHDANWNTSE